MYNTFHGYKMAQNNLLRGLVEKCQNLWKLNTQLVGGGVVNYPNHLVTITNTKHKAYFVYLFLNCQIFEILNLGLIKLSFLINK
jgi:hypothetical protein